jgi:hypothetical protein
LIELCRTENLLVSERRRSVEVGEEQRRSAPGQAIGQTTQPIACDVAVVGFNKQIAARLEQIKSGLQGRDRIVDMLQNIPEGNQVE